MRYLPKLTHRAALLAAAALLSLPWYAATARRQQAKSNFRFPRSASCFVSLRAVCWRRWS